MLSHTHTLLVFSLLSFPLPPPPCCFFGLFLRGFHLSFNDLSPSQSVALVLEPTLLLKVVHLSSSSQSYVYMCVCILPSIDHLIVFLVLLSLVPSLFGHHLALFPRPPCLPFAHSFFSAAAVFTSAWLHRSAFVGIIVVDLIHTWY